MSASTANPDDGFYTLHATNEMEASEKWMRTLKLLPHVVLWRTELAQLPIPRPYYLGSSTSPIHKLHGFCDASEKAYAVVV